MCAAVAPELASDERFAGFDERSEHREALLAILRPRFRGVDHGGGDRAAVGARASRAARSTTCWACSTIRRWRRATRSSSYAHPRLGEVRQFASPLRMGTSYTPAPARGEGTEPLLRELCGYDDARLRTAREEGAFG